MYEIVKYIEFCNYLKENEKERSIRIYPHQIDPKQKI